MRHRSRIILLVLAALLLAVAGLAVAERQRDDAPEDARSDSPPAAPLAVAFEPDDTALDDCDRSEREAFRCIRQAYGNLAWERGADVALARLVIAQRDPRADEQPDCHAIAHRIGRAAISRTESLEQAFDQGTTNGSMCGWGYYHGALERAFVGEGVGELATAGVAACSGAVVRTVDDREQCIHGLGHGFAVAANYDVPAALRACDGLDVEDPSDLCGIGVMMENATLAIISQGVETTYVRPDDPVHPCGSLPSSLEQHERACWLMVNRRWFAEGQDDWAEILDDCRAIGDSEAAWCLEGTGISLGVETPPKRVARVCYGALPHPDLCVRGAAWQMLNERPARADELCRLVHRDLRADCTRYVAAERARRIAPA